MCIRDRPGRDPRRPPVSRDLVQGPGEIYPIYTTPLPAGRDVRCRAEVKRAHGLEVTGRGAGDGIDDTGWAGDAQGPDTSRCRLVSGVATTQEHRGRRQQNHDPGKQDRVSLPRAEDCAHGALGHRVDLRLGPVSYTHLTLPTKRIV